MEVKLVSYTPDPDYVVACAARVCYTGKTVAEIYDKLKANPEETQEFVKKLLDSHHESPVEHTLFTFSIEGVSRALSHQLVRHRIASYSQKSQRYVNETGFDYVIPPAISRNPKAAELYEDFMAEIQEKYEVLVAMGIAKEDARYVLPNACHTTIIVSMNARSLYNFFGHRCCMRAQGEIRKMADEMLKLVKEVAPMIFSRAGANCVSLGYCPEGEKCCGKAPTLNQLLEAYDSWQNMAGKSAHENI